MPNQVTPRQHERNDRAAARNIQTLWGDPDGDVVKVSSLTRNQLEEIALEAYNLSSSIMSRNPAHV